MALTATIYNFDIELADTDRAVYESLALRVAQHPSESDEYLVARLLAYLLEYTEGIEFSRGVSDPDEPTIAVRDLTGRIKTWIEIGTPDAARLHKASKAADRVAVYTHKDPTVFLKQLTGEKIFRAEALELYALDRAMVSAFVARLQRRVAFSLSVTDHELYLSFSAENLKGGAKNLTGAVVRLAQGE
ncbi:MAG: YaeQ family protein [Acidobacteria bacterium]|nr:YaeQ family protein [Acidobacteriota bacterium]